MQEELVVKVTQFSKTFVVYNFAVRCIDTGIEQAIKDLLMKYSRPPLVHFLLEICLLFLNILLQEYNIKEVKQPQFFNVNLQLKSSLIPLFKVIGSIYEFDQVI